jgi:hypothetical protein
MRDHRPAPLLLLAVLLGALAAPAAAQADLHPEADDPELLVTGLEGGSGSTVGPDGALYVPEPVSGEVSRIDPDTGETTVVASCLPPRVLVGDAGGAMDVAFLGSTMYALTALVSADVGGSAVTGIFRVEDDTCEVVADIGVWTMENPPPPDFDFVVPTGVPYAMEAYREGFLVTDGHANRVLQVSLDGEVRTVLQLGNVVPLGLDVVDRTVYLTLAGPVPHLPEDGQVLTFHVRSADPELVASGGRLLVDVEAGPHALYALAQGDFREGAPEGSPALPDTGQLLVANRDSGFEVVGAGLDRPTSVEVVDGNAYVVTYDGEIWRLEDLPGGQHHRPGRAPAGQTGRPVAGAPPAAVSLRETCQGPECPSRGQRPARAAGRPRTGHYGAGRAQGAVGRGVRRPRHGAVDRAGLPDLRTPDDAGEPPRGRRPGRVRLPRRHLLPGRAARLARRGRRLAGLGGRPHVAHDTSARPPPQRGVGDGRQVGVRRRLDPRRPPLAPLSRSGPPVGAVVSG